jgi:hypothetical protein
MLALACPAASQANTGAVAALNAQIAARGVWGNTSSNTPTVFQAGASPCVQKVAVRSSTSWPDLAAKWSAVPLPCYHQPSSGTDEEEVLLTPDHTYEFWGMEWNSAPFSNIWSARWGGGEPNSAFTQYVGGIRAWPNTIARYGGQASGIALYPGIITVHDLQQGHIDHAVEIDVVYACWTTRFPATGSDGLNTANCLQYGTLFKLPASVDCNGLGLYRVARMVCGAAQRYGLIVADQSHDRVTFRFENWKRKWASWSPDGSMVDPYTDLNQRSRGLDFFGCDGYTNGVPKPPGQEWDCYPSEKGVFRNFPWSQLVEANG